MADKTIGEVYADNSGVPASTSKMEWENAAGSASGGSTIDELAQSPAFGDRYAPIDVGDDYLPLVAGGASVENVGAIESNVNVVAATGATETLDTAVYGWHVCTMDQACTFTFSNPAPSGKGSCFILELRGAFTPTFPASVDWGDAAAPTYTTPSQYVFTTRDAGTTWLGFQAAKAIG